MKWFDQWFFRKCKWAWENRDGRLVGVGNDCVPQIRKQAIDVEESWGDGLRINVRKVIGGYVVSFRTYDRIKDRSDERHYIINDDQEFDRELGKIITLESMRQT